MDKILLIIIRIVLQLFEDAQKGDKKALEKLKSFLPEHLQTEITAKIQDELDKEKFGER